MDFMRFVIANGVNVTALDEKSGCDAIHNIV